MLVHFTSAYRFSAPLILLSATVFGETAANGLSTGSRIPPFSLKDQTGISRSFSDIRGPKGALLVFYRSADW
jgi:hypothetical protein